MATRASQTFRYSRTVAEADRRAAEAAAQHARNVAQDARYRAAEALSVDSEAATVVGGALACVCDDDKIVSACAATPGCLNYRG